MRRTPMFVAFILLGAAVVACGSDGDAAMTPSEVIEAEVAAENAGDTQAIVAMWSSDATIYDGQVPEWVGDFDGDGMVSPMDIHMSEAAMGTAMDKQADVACTEVSDTVVECTYTLSTAFSDAAGVEPAEMQMRVTVEEGLIVDMEPLGPSDEAAFGAYVEANLQAMEAYQDWVATTHGDDVADLFIDDTGEPRVTAHNIELHQQRMTEFVGTLDT
jgi:hypothetical protein